MIQRRYKMEVTPEMSRKVQLIAFKHGKSWGDRKEVMKTDMPYLFIDDNSLEALGEDDDTTFLEDINELITPEKFIQLYGNHEPDENGNLW